MERLNKYLAHAGVGSRRHCDDLITQGRVRIDGAAVRELGTRIDPAGHEITVDGQPIATERPVYWLVHKPRGYLSTNHDQQGRPRVIDLVEHVSERVYTVGRLDEDSEGLILMTNDGDLAFKLMHPRFGVYKTYLVQVAGKPTREDLQKLLDGVWLSDGHVKAKRLRRLKSQGESTWLEIVLAEGKNREIRRMLAQLDHKVMRLKRTAIGPIRLDRLAKGKSRRLKPDEVELLRRACERKPKTDEPKPVVQEARPKGERPSRPVRPADAPPAARGERTGRPVRPADAPPPRGKRVAPAERSRTRRPAEGRPPSKFAAGDRPRSPRPPRKRPK